MYNTIFKLAQWVMKNQDAKTENLFEGPFTEQKVELFTLGGELSGKVYIQGKLNEKLCGRGKFNITRLVHEHKRLDKTMYAERVPEHEYKMCEYEGEVVRGKLHGQGTCVGSIGGWLLDPHISAQGPSHTKKSIKGNFEKNSITGIGEYYCDDRLFYRGNFKEGVIDGEGVFYLENGINLKMNARDFRNSEKYKNVTFRATFFNNHDNSLILEGVFTHTYSTPKGYRMLSGNYYVDNRPYPFNEY